MMLNRQFEAPTFAQINNDLRAYHALLFRTADHFFLTSRREPYAELTAVDHDITRTFQLLFNFETELHRRSTPTTMQSSSTTSSPRQKQWSSDPWPR